MQCARVLSSQGFSVLVLERSQNAGEPNFSTGGIPNFVLKEFKLPKTVVIDSFTKVTLFTPKNHATFDYAKPAGYVLDFAATKIFLAQEVEKTGGEVVYGASVCDIKVTDTGAQGVYLKTGGEMHFVHAKYIVDATAKESVLASKMGLKKGISTKPTVGMEVILKTKLDKFYKNNLILYIGKKFIPHGYAWIFPFGPNTYKIGAIRYDGSHGDALATLDDYIQKLIASVALGENHTIERHGGTLLLNTGYETNTWHNVVMIGDAAGLCNPLFAEGIRHALWSGQQAANAITKNNVSLYTEALQEYKKSNWQISRLCANMLYHFPYDTARDWLAAKVTKLTPQELLELVFNYKYKLLTKLCK